MNQPERRSKTFASLGDVIDDYIRSRGLESKRQEFSLQERWDEIVGEPISSHTTPDTIRFGTLHILVDNSAWLQQLNFLKPELMRKVESFLGQGVLKDIALRLGRNSSPRA